VSQHTPDCEVDQDGKSKPIETNETEEEHQKNRRVEAVLETIEVK
jgi:outer membrane protein OmpA-like peptidoglycan-associated protein